jgi:glycosyltransferase involved in cell wall biosynthesis
MSISGELWQAYKLRWKRRRLLYRAIRKRHQLKSTVNRTGQINPDTILVVSTVRNEIIRLPYFLAHHRKLGVGHFLFADNGSDDGTIEFLCKQPDVSLWVTTDSYKKSRFGVDWVTWLQMKYAHKHWCLTLDADELFIYPDYLQRNLTDLTDWLDMQGTLAMGVLMLDMYPKGPISCADAVSGADPCVTLGWFDGNNYTWERQSKFGNISIRGGARKRKFFSNQPDLAPHMHKTPLIKWNRSYVYASSTHIALPPRLNNVFDIRNEMPTGVLLHSKFLNIALEKSNEEKQRREHFTHADNYNLYYDQIIADPDFWHNNSVQYKDWHQLHKFGLMTGGRWYDPKL